jgi:hypothetical protein
MPKYLHLLITPVRHWAIWLVESREARIWMHHRSELVEFVGPGMLFKTGRLQVHQMLNHTEIDGMKNISFNNSRWRDAVHIPGAAF